VQHDETSKGFPVKNPSTVGFDLDGMCNIAISSNNFLFILGSKLMKSMSIDVKEYCTNEVIS
jgi:hypothetical protein